jgi:hypothetical protein
MYAPPPITAEVERPGHVFVDVDVPRAIHHDFGRTQAFVLNAHPDAVAFRTCVFPWQPIAFRVDPAYAAFPGPLVAAEDVVVGMTLIYPCWVGPRVEHLPRTVQSIVEYPDNRVLYFADTNGRPGLFGMVARRGVVKVAAT